MKNIKEMVGKNMVLSYLIRTWKKK